MAIVTSEGIVLKTHALGETSRIVVVYTREHGMVKLVAKGIAFDPRCLAAPAGASFTIDFDNEDPATAHNVHVFSANPAANPGARSLFMGDLVTGPNTSVA